MVTRGDNHLEKLKDSVAKFSTGDGQRKACSLFDEAGFPRDYSLLDVGCGTGEITLYMARHLTGGDVVGIDISKDRIEYAMRHNNHPNLKFANVSFEEKQPHKSYDVITFFSSLHWICDTAAALQRAHGLLSARGGIVVQSYCRGILRRAIDHVRTDGRWKVFFNNFSDTRQLLDKKSYAKLIESSGFKTKLLRSTSHIVNFPDAMSAAMSIANWLEGVERIPLDQREDFLKEIMDMYAKLDPGALLQNGVRLEFPTVEFICDKGTK